MPSEKSGGFLIVDNSKNLRFKFQPSKGLTVNDPVPVALIGCPQVAGRNRMIPAGGIGCVSSPGGQQLPFLLLLSFTDGHRKPPLFCQRQSKSQHQ